MGKRKKKLCYSLLSLTHTRARALSLTLCAPKKQPLIGIFPANAVLGTDSILWHQTEEKTHTYPDVESSAKKAGLDHNHSHFILVEDEVGTDFGAEYHLRQEFEGAFRQHRVDERTNQVPVVSICGTETCTEPLHHARAHRHTQT